MKTARQQLVDKAVSLGRLTRQQAEKATTAYLIDHIKAVELEELYGEEQCYGKHIRSRI